MCSTMLLVVQSTMAFGSSVRGSAGEPTTAPWGLPARHRQAIDIPPPAVPSANDCAHEPSVGLRHEEDGGGLGEELEDLLAVVGGARSRLRLSPQGENLLGLVGPRGT